MSKKHIVVLTDKQITLLLSQVFTEYVGSLDNTGTISRASPADAKNLRMLDSIETALANSMEV